MGRTNFKGLEIGWGIMNFMYAFLIGIKLIIFDNLTSGEQFLGIGTIVCGLAAFYRAWRKDR